MFLLGACSGGGSPAGGSAGAPTPSAPPVVATSAPDTKACSGGLTGSESGVVRVTCNGTADVKIQVPGTSRELRGGQCQSAGGVWSVSVGVVIDETGLHGAYTGPPVDVVTVNNTSTAGKATIQAVLGGKHYFDLGTAALTLSADQKTAHVVGTGDHDSDAPGGAITVDVTC